MKRILRSEIKCLYKLLYVSNILIWPASCEKGPSNICKKCRSRPAAASETQRLIRICTFWLLSNKLHLYCLLCKQFDKVLVFPTLYRSWSDAGHILFLNLLTPSNSRWLLVVIFGYSIQSYEQVYWVLFLKLKISTVRFQSVQSPPIWVYTVCKCR